MTATATTRMQDGFAVVPSLGTYPMAANTLLLKGTAVARDANGRAVAPTDGDGLNWCGISRATFDNRIGAEAGGTNDDLDAEVDYGIGGFAISGTTPKAGDVVYSVDNQTVSADPFDATGAKRGIAGVCTEVRTLSAVSQAIVFVGPHVAASVNGVGSVSVPIGPLPAWNDGVANGFDASIPAFGYNPTIDDEPFTAIVALPDDLDTDSDLHVRARMSISSVATDDDVVAVLLAKINGGADVAPVSTTVLAVAAQNIDFVIAAANVPAGAKALYLEVDCAGTLDTADAYLHSLEVVYVRK